MIYFSLYITAMFNEIPLQILWVVQYRMDTGLFKLFHLRRNTGSTISVQRNAIHADDTTSSQTADGLQRTARFLQHWLWAFWDAGDTGGDKSPSSLHLFKILGRLTALSMASLWKKLTTYTCRASSDSHKTRETGSRQPIPPCHVSCCVFINHVLTIRIKIAIFQPV